MEDTNLMLQKVISFIVQFNNVYESFSINEKARIEEDLKITGDDAYEFIIMYGRLFNVDISDFSFNEYFNSEGYPFFPILEFFGLKEKRQKKELTVGDLIKGIQTGRLDEKALL